jgi:hypothetical protein
VLTKFSGARAEKNTDSSDLIPIERVGARVVLAAHTLEGPKRFVTITATVLPLSYAGLCVHLRRRNARKPPMQPGQP